MPNSRANSKALGISPGARCTGLTVSAVTLTALLGSTAWLQLAGLVSDHLE